MLRSIPLAILLFLGPWNHLLADSFSLTKRLQSPLAHTQNGTAGTLHPVAAAGNVSLVEGDFPWDTLRDIVKKVGGASDTINNISSAIGGIADSVGSVADIVDRITSIFGTNSDIVDKIKDAAEKVTDVSSTVSDATGAVGHASDTFADILGQLAKMTRPVEQGGHSETYINRVLCVLIGFIMFVILLCFFLENRIPQCAPAPGRPRLWLSGMLLSSYAILIPGLVQALFSFTLAIQLLGLQLTVTKRSENTSEAGPITESMISVVGTLHRTGSNWGAILVVLYAMVIPALKLVLLFVGELWRFSKVPAQVATARWCIRFVQMISKWACPDMFAYILLLYLLRSLDRRSSLIEAPAHLDDGFSCFSIFCVCSTFSSLAIPLPDRPSSGLEATEGDGREEAPPSPPSSSREESKGRARGLLWATGGLFALFAVFFCVGLILPCMALQLESSLLVQPEGPLPQGVLPFLQALDLESQVNSEVTLWDCVAALTKWWYLGEANCILALIMLGVFAMLLPVINMVVLVFAAEAAETKVESNPGDEKPPAITGAMELARIIKHISMLDVAIMGVIVICLAGKSYKEQGIVFHMRWGLFFLFLAEVVHYVTYYMVQSAHKAAKEEAARQIS